jgi:two-component system NtrC family sensor kinase
MAKRPKTARQATKKRKASAPRKRSADAGARKETSRLKRELAEALERQKATGEILAAISHSTSELQPILDTIVRTASRLCDAEFALIYKLKDGEYHPAAANNATTTFIKYAAEHPLAPGRDTLIGRTALEQKTVHLPDCLADPEYKAFDYQRAGKYRSMLGVPLQQGGAPIGVIALMRAVVKPFTDKQIELVTTFANQAVIAIENARLFDEVNARTRDLAESLEQQTATSEVLRVISSTPGELEPVFQTMLENATRICGAHFGALNLYDGDCFIPVAYYNVPPAYAASTIHAPIRPHPEGGLGQVVRTKKLAHFSDIRTSRGYVEGNPAVVALADTGDARTLLIVPMLKDSELVGTIAIYRQEVRLFTDKQIELLSNFAAQAVIAIENTRLLKELRQRTDDLSESLEQQTATADVLKVISRSTLDSKPNLETVLGTLVESAVRLCGATRGHVFRYDGASLLFCAAYGASPGFREWLRAHPFKPGRESVAGRAALELRVCHIHDVLADPEYTVRELVEYQSFRSALGVPMLAEGKLLGVIAIVKEKVEPFTNKQIALVSTFADQAVIALENVRLFEEVNARTEDLRESLQQQTATADVLKVISRSTFDLQSVLHTLVESAARLCEADKATITRQRDGAFYRAESFGFSREFMDHVRDIPVAADRGSATGRALLEGVVVHIPDVQADPDYHFNEALRLGNYRTLLGVPMLREGTPIGVVTLTCSEARPFTEKQIELVATFADQAAIAIENVRLFESVEARTRELAASLEELRAAQDRLVQTEKLASLGQLTAGIAHEIKNPLNFVNNFSALSVELVDELGEVLKPAPLDDKTRQETDELALMLKGNLEKVVLHGKRADSIVKNMLLHSREGSGERRPVDINSLVGESLNLAYHGARAEKQGFQIRLDQDFDPAAGEAELLPQEITRVLLNLISNGFYAAMKRKANDGHDGYEPALAAATRNLGDRVEIRIRDNGSGIPPEVKEKMFNPFFTTKPPGEGTGLGLSLSYDIVVKQHSGSIEVDTRPGEFTEFRVVLPRTAASPDNSPARPSTQIPRPQYPHQR